MYDLEIRTVCDEDIPHLYALIGELADYEKLTHEFVGAQDDLRRSLSSQKAHALLAWVDGAPVGYALWFYSFSTFRCMPGLYLEDVYVRPACRGRGYGGAILRHLARRAVDEGCARMEWSVLDWNQSAISFYRKLGARPMDGWTVYRLDGEALARAGKGT